MISDRLLAIVRCPDCRGRDRARAATRLRLSVRAADRGRGAADYLDLRPLAMFTEQTKYLDEALHADARHAHVSPPLLGAGVRQRHADAVPAPVGRRPRRGPRAAAAGSRCVWNAGSGASLVGVDVEPVLRRRGRSSRDRLVLGDLRRLPFADDAFSKGYALDVFEHLSREGLDGRARRDRARASRPGGACSSTRTCGRTPGSRRACAGRERALARGSSGSASST